MPGSFGLLASTYAISSAFETQTPDKINTMTNKAIRATLETELETFETQFFAKAIAHFLVELGLICDKHEIQVIGGVIPVIMDLEGNELWQGQERDLHTKWADLYYGDIYELGKWLEDDAGYRHQYFEYTNENKMVV